MLLLVACALQRCAYHPRDLVRLELNPLQSVLAEVKQEDWRTAP